MSDRADWAAMRDRRMAEPGAAEAYDAARLAFELGRRATGAVMTADKVEGASASTRATASATAAIPPPPEAAQAGG